MLLDPKPRTRATITSKEHKGQTGKNQKTNAICTLWTEQIDNRITECGHTIETFETPRTIKGPSPVSREAFLRVTEVPVVCDHQQAISRPGIREVGRLLAFPHPCHGSPRVRRLLVQLHSSDQRNVFISLITEGQMGQAGRRLGEGILPGPRGGHRFARSS